MNIPGGPPVPGQVCTLLVQPQLSSVITLNKALTFVSRFAFNTHYLVGFSEQPCKAVGERYCLHFVLEEMEAQIRGNDFSVVT